MKKQTTINKERLINEYIEECLEKAFTYENQVINNEIVVSEWIKKAVIREQKLREKYNYRLDKVKEVFKFFYFINIEPKKQFKPLPFQAWIVLCIYSLFRNNDRRLRKYGIIWIARKNGKALCLNTPIPTPEGFTTMGNLKVGDYIFGKDGQLTKVTYKSPIYYNNDCYKITFEDGEVIIADANHNWNIFSSKWKTNQQRILTTEQIKDDFIKVRTDNKGNEYKYRVPQSEPLELPEKDLILDPYILGAWIGDGCKNNPSFTCSKEDLVMYDYITETLKDEQKLRPDNRNPNTYNVSYAGKRGKKANGSTSNLWNKLNQLNLLDNKHIPKEYLRASKEQRLALLQGLMDTDGTVSKSGQCEFVQKSDIISDAFSDLLGTLGIKFTWKKEMSKYNGKECGLVNRFTFYTDKKLPCFKLQRKYDRLKDSLNKRMLYKSIVNIEKVESVPTQCITVDNNNHLYLCGTRYTVTHNTAFTAVLSLYELVKGESEAEVYFLATTAQQAAQGLKYLKSIIDYSPALKERIDVLQYHLRYNKHSKLKPLANNPSKLDGLNPSFALLDESHSHPNRDLFNIIDSGMKARKEPLLIEISTAGFNKSYPFFNQLEIGKSVLNDELEQDNTFYAFYTLDNESEIEEPDKWIKANPSLGTIIDYDTLIEDYDKACKTASDKDSFIIKNLNFYKDISDTWIPDEVYKECFIDYNIEDLKGCKAWLGIDLASTRDLASLAVLIEKENQLFVKVENFLPDNPDSLVRMNGLDLQSWIDKGYIVQTESKTTDYNYIKERVKFYIEHFQVQTLGFDKWNSSQFIPDLQVNLGLHCRECPQNTNFFNFPLRELESLIYNRKIILSKNPVLRWMFRNVVLYRDSNDNIKIMKNKKKDSVDSVVALAMALAMYLQTKKYDI